MHVVNPNADQALLQRIAGGDEQAFKELFDRYYTMLYRYVLSVTKAPEIAEELVSDVLLKCWLGREALPEVVSLEGFLVRMARNKAIDFLRLAAREQRLQQLLAQEIKQCQLPVAGEIMDAARVQQLLQQALDQLSPIRRQIFELHRQGGFTHRQIAEQLQLSPHTVRNNISVALQTIRDHLQANGVAPAVLLIVLLAV